jgi:hypothetical protein
MDTRVAPVHVHDAKIEACLDGSLLVRNPEPLRRIGPPMRASRSPRQLLPASEPGGDRISDSQ